MTFTASSRSRTGAEIRSGPNGFAVASMSSGRLTAWPACRCVHMALSTSSGTAVVDLVERC